MTDRPAPATLVELIDALSALSGLPPLERARQAPVLINAAKGVLARERVSAFREAMASGMSQAEIARQVGISRSKVNDALQER